mmetsp:Transcript_6195/g.11285  ORF Transcript_6195/g.11285 Transcript_6195/m.11285 type:complete len:135 (-) Transcript_6195:303-707(-)
MTSSSRVFHHSGRLLRPAMTGHHHYQTVCKSKTPMALNYHPTASVGNAAAAAFPGRRHSSRVENDSSSSSTMTTTRQEDHHHPHYDRETLDYYSISSFESALNQVLQLERDSPTTSNSSHHQSLEACVRDFFRV